MTLKGLFAATIAAFLLMITTDAITLTRLCNRHYCSQIVVGLCAAFFFGHFIARLSRIGHQRATRKSARVLVPSWFGMMLIVLSFYCAWAAWRSTPDVLVSDRLWPRRIPYPDGIVDAIEEIVRRISYNPQKREPFEGYYFEVRRLIYWCMALCGASGVAILSRDGRIQQWYLKMVSVARRQKRR